MLHSLATRTALVLEASNLRGGATPGFEPQRVLGAGTAPAGAA